MRNNKSENQNIDYITVKGFKSIANIDKLPLHPINILIGPNGSGKSNFIQVFSFLHALKEGRLQEYVAKVGGADKLLFFGSKITSELKILISFCNEKNKYEISLIPTNEDTLFPSEEQTYFWNRERYPEGPPYCTPLYPLNNEAAISKKNLTGIDGWIRDHLAKWRLYHFHDTGPNSPMKKMSNIDDNRFLREDASNLPSFLYYLSQKQKNSYELIRSTVQRVTPFFDDFQLSPSKLNPDKIRLEWRHKKSDKYFDVSSLSDGTLRFIALATLFLQPDILRPSVILIDEPELGLHPYAITMLASLIKMASKKTQVLITTQSPLLLDQFKPEDVLVANRIDGGTSLSRLDSKKLDIWLEDYSLGQLWEKNQLGGRPTGE